MATVNGTSGSDTLNGTSGNDTLNGLGGNDTLVGSGGTDFYDGGAGFDTLDFRSAAVGLVVNFATGTVNGEFSGSFANMERLLSGNGADSITGAAGGQNLSGRTGNDTLAGGAGIDTLYSGIGTDHFVFRETGSANADLVQDFESGVDKIRLDASVMTALGPIGNFTASDGRFVANSTGTAQDAGDRVLYNTTTRQIFYDADGNGSGAKVLIATLQSGATLIATDIIVQDASGASGQTINGTSGNDSLVGGPTNDTINGFDGEDTINGGAGADSMVGGADADTYLVDDVNDVIVELENGGFDTANASVSYTLPAWVNDLTLTGAALEGTGNELPNVITGSSANNDLDGGSGNDTLAGLAGNDTVSGGDGSDFLDGGSGNDTVYGGIDFASDTLIGGEGDDVLNGDHGADSMDGGLGNDFYVLDEEDVLTDAGGIDSIQVGGRDWTIPAGIENAYVAFGATLAIFGNELNNSIFGHSWHSRLEGRAGNDFLVGDGGDDTLLGGDGNDDFLGGDGLDILDGGSGNDSLHGGGDQDTLYGGTGNDTLYGDTGADAFLFDQPTAMHADLVVDFQSGQDKVLLDGIALGAVGRSGNFAPGDARFWAATGAVSGHDADDRIVYNTLTGDLYYDADGNGAAAAERIATLQSAPAISSTDIAVINGSGGGGGQVINGTSGNDYLVGGPGNDTIDGLAGEDTMEGGSGDDLYFVDQQNDVIVEAQSGGVDEVRSSGDAYFLPAWVENLTLISTARHGLGNDIDNVVTGNSADNELYGRAGNDVVSAGDGHDGIHGGSGDDTLLGGAGSDTFYQGDFDGTSPGNDVIDGGPDEDWLRTDPFPTQSGVIVNLASGTVSGGGEGGAGSASITSVEHVVGTGFADLIIGNSANNALQGAAGNDTLEGGGGPGLDQLEGGAGADVFVFGAPRSVGTATVVLDFTTGEDTVRLNGALMPALGPSGRFAADDPRFYAAAGATSGHDADDRIIYNMDTGLLYYDADGSSSGSALIIGQLVAPSGPTFPPAPLAASDIEVVNGTAPGEVITGTSGADTLTGTAGNDTINGLGGNDMLVGSGGSDFYDGGAQFDTLNFTAASSGVVVDFAAGTLAGGFSGTFANIERVLASDAADSLIGAAGGQNLSGRGGNDTVAGGTGNDTLYGGTGADSFVFREMGTANADRVNDFASGADKLALDDAAFTAVGATGNFAAGDARFWSSSTGTAHDANDRVIYNTSTGSLYYDADGSGSGASQLIATMQSGATVAATDIVVI